MMHKKMIILMLFLLAVPFVIADITPSQDWNFRDFYSLYNAFNITANTMDTVTLCVAGDCRTSWAGIGGNASWNETKAREIFIAAGTSNAWQLVEANITDLGSYLTSESDPSWTANKSNYVVSGTVDAWTLKEANISDLGNYVVQGTSNAWNILKANVTDYDAISAGTANAWQLVEANITDLTHTVDTNETVKVTRLNLNQQTINNTAISKAGTGNCVGQVVQNITTSGVQCVSAGTDTNESVKVNLLISKVNAVNTTANIEELGFVTGGAEDEVNQNVNTTGTPTFVTVDTGQGANELYDMNQNVMTTSEVQFSKSKIYYATQTYESLTAGTAAHFVIGSGTTDLVFTNYRSSYPYGTSIQARHSTTNGLSYPIMLNPLGGNIGIGNSDPKVVLDVTGAIKTSDCLEVPGGGRLCGNTTCTWMYSPNNATKVMACN